MPSILSKSKSSQMSLAARRTSEIKHHHHTASVCLSVSVLAMMNPADSNNTLPDEGGDVLSLFRWTAVCSILLRCDPCIVIVFLNLRPFTSSDVCFCNMYIVWNDCFCHVRGRSLWTYIGFGVLEILTVSEKVNGGEEVPEENQNTHTYTKAITQTQKRRVNQ